MTDDSRRWFAVPAPVRALFNNFPLQVYDPEPLPCRAPELVRPRPALYVFAGDHHDADRGRPSFNPSCLKWQTFLRIAGVEVDLVPSNNHASPSGVLPFLLPPTQNARPLTGDKILQYARDEAAHEPPGVPPHRLEAYQALLSHSIRPAWLHALYVNPSNAALLRRLYLPKSPLLSYPLHQTLVTAAEAEILKTARASVIQPDQLLANASDAFEALSTLLGDDEWFFGSSTPGIFDAEVFAYTWLILDEELMGWEDNIMGERLRLFDNLVAHRQRLYSRCWGEKGSLS